jgi:hypothetical protein
MANPVIEVLLRQLNQAFDTRSWHGTNLMGSLRGLDRSVVAWRPQPGRHNIAELAVHAAYWKYRVFRLITDAEPRSFELAGSDFFAREGEPNEPEWRADVELLRAWHRRLAAAVATFPVERLNDVPGRGRFTCSEVIGGAAAHDLYHAGQIQLIKRLYAHR